MALTIDTSNSIIIDGQDTGLKMIQRADKTVIFTPENWSKGVLYQSHSMPYTRYSAAHDAPSKPGQSYDPKVTAGRAQLESDVKGALLRIKGYAAEDAAIAAKLQADVDYDNQQRAAGNQDHL